jgi:hypothetical protein
MKCRLESFGGFGGLGGLGGLVLLGDPRILVGKHERRSFRESEDGCVYRERDCSLLLFESRRD